MEGEGCRVQLSVLSRGHRKWLLYCPKGGSHHCAAQEQEHGEMFTARWLELNWITSLDSVSRFTLGIFEMVYSCAFDNGFAIT